MYGGPFSHQTLSTLSVRHPLNNFNGLILAQVAQTVEGPTRPARLWALNFFITILLLYTMQKTFIKTPTASLAYLLLRKWLQRKPRYLI